MHRSLLKRFPLFIWPLFAVSSVPTFRPDTGSGGGLLFRLLGPSRCGEALALLSLSHCSGSRLLYMERALHWARFQPSGVPQKRSTKSLSWFLCLPRPIGSGSQELDGRTLPGCGAPFPLRGPSLSFRLRRSGACALCLTTTRCQPSRISGSLWLETGGLSAVR